MGFLDRLENSIDDFVDFSPRAYRREINNLSENQLRARHKEIQRKIAGAGAQMVAGGAGAVASGGLSLVLSGIGARRANVNSQKCDLIEARLREEGWSGHEFGFKDVLIGVGPSAVASVLAPGADHLASHLLSHATTTATTYGVAHATMAAAAQGTAHATTHGAAHSMSIDLSNHALRSGTHAGLQAGTGHSLEKWADEPPATALSLALSEARHALSEAEHSRPTQIQSDSKNPEKPLYRAFSRPEQSKIASTTPHERETRRVAELNSAPETCQAPQSTTSGRRESLWRLFAVLLNPIVCSLFGNESFTCTRPSSSSGLCERATSGLHPNTFSVL